MMYEDLYIGDEVKIIGTDKIGRITNLDFAYVYVRIDGVEQVVLYEDIELVRADGEAMLLGVLSVLFVGLLIWIFCTMIYEPLTPIVVLAVLSIVGMIIGYCWSKKEY